MKKILAIVLAMVMLLAFTACDNTRKSEYAYIILPNGNMVEVEVEHYLIHASCIDIIAKDGRRYTASMVNCLLTTDRLYEVGNGI